MTLIVEEVRQGKAFENKQGGDGENPTCHYRNHSSSIESNIVLKNLKPTMVLVENIK